MTPISNSFGVQATLYLIIHLVTLVITWWALQGLKMDLFLKHPQSPQAKVFLIFLTITISSIVADFFLNYLNWSLQLPGLFH